MLTAALLELRVLERERAVPLGREKGAKGGDILMLLC